VAADRVLRESDGHIMINAEAQRSTLADRAGAAFARYRCGDQAVMAELVEMLTPILWHTVRAQRMDATSTEDVLQTTWLALVRNADRIADPRSVLQWLIVSARREAWRVSRGQARQTPSEIDDDVVSREEPPEVLVERSATQQLLWSHIAKLPDRCRELLRVIAFADRPDYAELARSLGMPIGSIGPTRGRCLAKLRASLAADARWES
jgi:RNA polymerase sigma factor (sigma-70 family)